MNHDECHEAAFRIARRAVRVSDWAADLEHEARKIVREEMPGVPAHPTARIRPPHDCEDPALCAFLTGSGCDSCGCGLARLCRACTPENTP